MIRKKFGAFGEEDVALLANRIWKRQQGHNYDGTENTDDGGEENFVNVSEIATSSASSSSSIEKLSTRGGSRMTITTPTTTSATTTTTVKAISFEGGRRRGIVKSRSSPSFHPVQEEALENGSGGDDAATVDSFDEAVCAQLRVPCRFVNDHPCCFFLMPLELVARARAMDGSADIKWRRRNYGPKTRSVPQGRSLDLGKNNRVVYSHARQASGVRTPVYHLDGSVEAVSAVLGQCWRLLYLRCYEKREHPCCRLVSEPAPHSPADNLLTRWIGKVDSSFHASSSSSSPPSNPTRIRVE